MLAHGSDFQSPSGSGLLADTFALPGSFLRPFRICPASYSPDGAFSNSARVGRRHGSQRAVRSSSVSNMTCSGMRRSNWRLRRDGSITAFPDESFDLVLVDGRDERVACVESAAPKLRRGGLLVLDDRDHPAYRRVDRVLESWPRRVFIGLKPYPLTASETAIYRRP